MDPKSIKKLCRRYIYLIYDPLCSTKFSNVKHDFLKMSCYRSCLPFMSCFPLYLSAIIPNNILIINMLTIRFF